MKNQVIKIRLERYEELVKKEALLDKLLEDKKISIYLYEELVKKGVKNA